LNITSFNPVDVDFRDIVVTGSASPVTGTRLGDCGGNSGITFPAPKTVYWNLAGSQAFATNAWAITPAGPPSNNNFPLVQDTATFTDSGAADTVIINNFSFNYPSIDASARTSALTLNYAGTGLSYYGNFLLGPGITLSGINGVNFSGRGSHSITSSGKTFTGSITVDSVSGTYTFTDAHTNSSGVALTSGTLNTNNQTITTPLFNLNAGAATKVLNLGTSTINLTGTGTVWSFGVTSGFTLNSGSSTINLTDTSATARTFIGGGLTYGTLNIGGTTGTSTLTLSGTGTTFNNITSTKTVAHTIFVGTSNTINFNNFNVSGSAGNLVSLSGSSQTGSIFNYTGSGVVAVNYIAIGSANPCIFRPLPDPAGSTPYRWYLGANSTNTITAGPSPLTLGASLTSGSRIYAISSTATRSWTVPDDWNSRSNNIYMIGAGGGGNLGVSAGNNRAASGGGGGGGYTGLTNLSLAPMSILPLAVGSGGAATGLKGGDTYIDVQYSAGGGQGGIATTVPASAGGAGGIGATYNGGAGGAGSFGTTASAGYGSGGGGGAAGPLGTGGAGGAGFGSATAADIAGGGGGGNGGGSAGGNASGATAGNGGNNFSGTGGGVGTGVSGINGGGGAGGVNTSSAGSGGAGTDILNTIGGSGGEGGVYSASSSQNGYGSGGRGGAVLTFGNSFSPGAGLQGLIVIAYQPLGINLGSGITAGPGIVITSGL
jgi:hypothetical protein